MVRMELATEIVLLDIKEGFAEGKAMDMNQCATLHGFDAKVKGVTSDYSATAGSEVVVITSGLPRKPGMTREELIGTNAGIVRSVVSNALAHSPNAIIVVISNPMDTMTYLAAKESGLPKNRIIGMGGILDSSRFKYYLSEAMGVPASDLQGTVVGGHGDTTMIPFDAFGDLPVYACFFSPFRSEIGGSESGHHGGRCYLNGLDWHICVVCSRCSRCRFGSEHCPRPKESFPLLRLPRRRIRPKRHLLGRTRGDW